MSGSYIYFIQARGKGPIKIGFTADNPYKRMVKIQSDCPWRVRLLGAIKGTTAQEKQIHLVLARWRIQGEWFEPNRFVMAAIKEAMKCGQKIDPIKTKARTAKYDHPLCHYRAAHKLSLKDIASRTGINDASLSHIESGYRMPSSKMAKAIIEATDLTLADLRPDIVSLMRASQ